jgi:hypothetical protein
MFSGCADLAALIVDRERTREFPISVDLLLQLGDLPLCRGNRVRAGEETTRQFIGTRQLD